jgi:phosphate starvation-inducible PhoH-like protein
MPREQRKKKTATPRAKVRPKARHNFAVKAKTPGQQEYIRSISDNVVTLCSGYAGTGKTLIAIGKAMELWQRSKGGEREYAKIVVVRPAVEACGETIGFLPGGINDKMRPLIQPVIDNLRFFVTDEGYLTTLLEPSNGSAPVIEVIPMAYLRGRTFNNCIVVFDEAQNSSTQQMKLFLTRIGKNSKVIIEGDITQSDKFRDRTKNGLADAMTRLSDCPGVGCVILGTEDIQRSSIIAPILERYEDIDGI